MVWGAGRFGFSRIRIGRRAVSSGISTKSHQTNGAAIDVLENLLDGELLDAVLGFARCDWSIIQHEGTAEI